MQMGNNRKLLNKGWFGMDIIKILSESGAGHVQICQYIDCQNTGNKKGQERILCRCKGIQNEKLQYKRRQLLCLDYMIAKVEKSDEG